MKEKNKVLLGRFLRVMVPLVLLAAMIIGNSLVEKDDRSADTSSVYCKATVMEVLIDQTGGQEFVGNQKVKAAITSGEYKGYSCELDNPNTYQIGAFCTEGTRIVALVRKNADGALVGSVYNYDRTGMVVLLLGLFAGILLLVGGWKGAAALYALVFTFACVLCVYVPLLYCGVNGILSAILTAVVILAVSIYIINGWTVKTVCAIIGTTLGVTISGVLAMIVGDLGALTGFHMDDVEAMMGMRRDIDIRNLLYAGILISSLGAVMDVSVSIVAAMQEIREKAPRLSSAELFASGMRVGHDMMGTMSNTLILAYAGSATTVLLYTCGMPFLKIMSYNSIMIEVLCGLCGTIGVILSVPIQAGITALILQPQEKKKK